MHRSRYKLSAMFLSFALTCAAAGDRPPSVDATDDSVNKDGESIESIQSGVKRVDYVSTLLGHIENRSLNEASGLALSTRTRDIAWSHNDSGNGPYAYAFSLSGESRGRFYLDNARSSDWEDMDAFRWRDTSWLLIADTGDNQSKKPDYALYIVAEPAVPKERSTRLSPLKGVRKARFTLPVGPADTEAVAVDEVEERVYLITKRRRPALVFSLPLAIFDDADALHEATFESELFALPVPTLQNIVDYPKLGLAFAQPNALDFAPDRSFAVVHTYGHSYIFSRRDEQSWAETFTISPEQLDVPLMKQSEAVAVGWDSRSLYYTSEGRKPPLYRLQPVGSFPSNKGAR